jgi:hypothetical protein
MAVSFEKKLDLIRKANATLKKEKITTLLGQASKIDSYSSENQTKIKGNVDSLYNQIAQAYAQKKKAVAQANAPTTKTRKKPKKEDTMMGYASMIMKRDNITWKQALKKSKDHFADLRTKKQDAEKKALEDFEKKVGAVEFEKATRYKIRGGTKGTDIERDKVRPALPSGKRIVRTKGKTTNQYGTYNNKIGKVYYEKRANRMDVNQPSKSVYPKLADGGVIGSGKNGYVAFYKGKRIEVNADTMYGAQKTAAKHFNAKKEWEVNVSLAEVDGKPYMQSTAFAKGGEVDKITPELNQKITKRAEEIYKLDGGKSQSDFDKAMNKAIVEYGFKPSSYHSAMMEIGAEYDDADGYYAKGGEVGNDELLEGAVDFLVANGYANVERDGEGNFIVSDLDDQDDYEVVYTPIEIIQLASDKGYNEDGMEDFEYAKGGKIGFDALAKKVARSYKGKKVKAKYQNEYGKTYDSKEAMEVGQKVASKVYRRQLARKSKMAQGGEVKNTRYRVLVRNNSSNEFREGAYFIEASSKEKAEEIALAKFKKEFGTKRGVSVFVDSIKEVPMENGKERTRKYFVKLRNQKGSEKDNFIIDAFEQATALRRAFSKFRKKYNRPSAFDDNQEEFSIAVDDIYPIAEIKTNGETTYKRTFAKGGEVDKKKYKFEITEYKDENAVINDEPTISDYEGTKEKVIDFQYQRMQRGYCVYFNITIVADSNNKGWFYESEDLDDLIDEIENSDDDNDDFEYTDYEKIMKAYGYAKGGEVAESNRNMALNKAKELCHHVDELHNVLKGKKHIEAWVIAKLERASSDLSDVTHYLDGLSEQKTH